MQVMAKKTRLDQLLVRRGLAESRSKAQALIMAGAVRVAGAVRTKAGELVLDEAAIEVDEPLPYVSRGGLKLAHALAEFKLSPHGLLALDVGASTGGFTDVLLQHGAAHVYAVDVGYGHLDWRLRQDPRVTVLERTNIRYLEALPPAPATLPIAEHTPPRAHCFTADVSFISLTLVLPAIQRLVTPGAWGVVLIKPQFEAGPEQVGKGGVVRDPRVHQDVIRRILTFASTCGLQPHGLARSPITGPAGNVEFLAWIGGTGPTLDLDHVLSIVV